MTRCFSLPNTYLIYATKFGRGTGTSTMDPTTRNAKTVMTTFPVRVSGDPVYCDGENHKDESVHGCKVRGTWKRCVKLGET